MSPADDMTRWKDRACARVEREREALVSLSERIHAHPELKFEEYQASVWVADYLEAAGFAVERGAFGLPTSFRATAGTGRPCVAVFCEYDALPEIGHACGHNIIAAAGAGAGVAILDVVREVGGTVTVLGSPAEEGGGGKILMAQAGALEGVDAAMMVHPADRDLSAMQVLACRELEVTYAGRAAHASAAPHHGINALDAIVTAYVAVAQLRQHIRSGERIHGIITEGGTAANVVPERTKGRFFVRGRTAEDLQELMCRVEGCFQAGALATGATLMLSSPAPEYADMRSSPVLEAAFGRNMARLGRQVMSVSVTESPVAGSTDMGNVSHVVPSIHPMVAAAPAGVPLHTPEFARWAGSDLGRAAVLDGARALAMTALDALYDAELLAAVRADFVGEDLPRA